ncbi:MAG: PDZ domain-containing protein [Acetobacteraceae bacterium]
MRRDLGILGRVSAEIAAMVRKAAPALASLSAGPGLHVSGFVWKAGVLVGSTRADGGVAMLPGGRSARIARFEAEAHPGLAAFRLSVAERETAGLSPAETSPSVGALVLALGSAPDASPTARLMIVSHAEADAIRLDGTPDPAAEGGPVLDADGKLLGMALASPDGGCLLLECAAIARALEDTRPGWIGVSFQPTLVPTALREAAGQESARLVVRTAKGGPAERAGLVVGDTVLTLDGIGLTGTGALRGFLAGAKPGRRVTARLVRGGRIETATLVVGADPDPSGQSHFRIERAGERGSRRPNRPA